MTSPTFVIAGKLTREYILPPLGNPLLDSPGGNLLYAAGGLAVWDANANAGLLGRVSEDYPQAWLQTSKHAVLILRHYHTAGSQKLICVVSLRIRIQMSAVNPMQFLFARRQLPFQNPAWLSPCGDSRKDPREPDAASPAALDVPKDFRDVRHVHLCPFDFVSQSQMVNLFKGGSNQTVSLDPAPGYMTTSFWRDLRLVLQGVTVFQPSEDEVRALFWGETNDLWEMAQQVSQYGPQIIVIKRGALGQLVYDAAGNHRYEVPAYSSRLADPTGAGDAFCGGYLAGFQKTNDPLMAAIHGSVSASLKIDGSGPFYPLEVLPGLAEARLHTLQEMAREV